MDPVAVAQLLQQGQPSALSATGSPTGAPAVAPTPQQLLAIQSLMNAPGGLGAMQGGAANPQNMQPGMGQPVMSPAMQQSGNQPSPMM